MEEPFTLAMDTLWTEGRADLWGERRRSGNAHKKTGCSADLAGSKRGLLGGGGGGRGGGGRTLDTLWTERRAGLCKGCEIDESERKLAIMNAGIQSRPSFRMPHTVVHTVVRGTSRRRQYAPTLQR